MLVSTHYVAKDDIEFQFLLSPQMLRLELICLNIVNQGNVVFSFHSFLPSVILSPFKTESHNVAQMGLKLMIHLPMPPNVGITSVTSANIPFKQSQSSKSDPLFYETCPKLHACPFCSY